MSIRLYQQQNINDNNSCCNRNGLFVFFWNGKRMTNQIETTSSGLIQACNASGADFRDSRISIPVPTTWMHDGCRYQNA
eukprot:3302593-Amphidinium_carterae.1